MPNLRQAPKLYSDREALVKLEQETRILKEKNAKLKEQNAEQKQKYENEIAKLKEQLKE